MKKAFLLIVGLVVLCGGSFLVLSTMGILGMGEAIEQAEKAPGGSRETAVGLQTAVTVGDLVYTVTEARTETMLEDESGLFEPVTAQGKYVLVRYAVENAGKDMNTVWSLELVDDSERQFQETTFVGDYVPQGEDCIFTSINPGMSETCTKVFEVPADASGLMFHISGIGLTESAYVDLGID